ncbi:MAG: M91 family zinc metallopeptidase [Planctomycetaceae bacterium]
MATKYDTNITIDGSISNAQSAAPPMPSSFTLSLPASWDAAKYEKVIVANLDSLRKSVAANAVLKQLKRQLTIRPWIWTPANAAAIPTNLADAVDDDDNTCGVAGTGHGSDSTVWITPKNRKIPDATLLHESVHAFRHMEGAKTCRKYEAKFDKEEEYFAILITNVFMSEKKRKLIRIDHRGNSWVDNKSPWDQFRVDPFLIMSFEMQHSSLSLAVGKAKEAEFNPFSPHFADRMRVR